MPDFRGHVFIGVSLDGFIARPDGDLSWLTERGLDMADSGYDEFIAGIDAIIMGRVSYETVLGFGEWPYTKPVFAISSTMAESGREDVQVVPDVEAAVEAFIAAGYSNAYIDGGNTIQSFLHAGLIETLTLSYAPVLIGAGSPLFGFVPNDVELELLESRRLPANFTQVKYRVRS